MLRNFENCRYLAKSKWTDAKHFDCQRTQAEDNSTWMQNTRASIKRTDGQTVGWRDGRMDRLTKDIWAVELNKKLIPLDVTHVHPYKFNIISTTCSVRKNQCKLHKV